MDELEAVSAELDVAMANNAALAEEVAEKDQLIASLRRGPGKQLDNGRQGGSQGQALVGHEDEDEDEDDDEDDDDTEDVNAAMAAVLDTDRDRQLQVALADLRAKNRRLTNEVPYHHP